MLPDLDHPDSTASRTWGRTTRTLARNIGSLSGGHRGATHDILAAPIASALIGGLAALHPVPAGAVLTFVTGLALAGVGLRRSPQILGVAAVLSGAIVITTPVLSWLPAALALGASVHILGDAVTNNSIPVPLTWLTNNGARRIGRSPMKTGGRVERWVLGPSLAAAILVAVVLSW